MKILLACSLLLSSFSLLAGDTGRSCTNALGEKVCAQVETIKHTVYMENFEPSIPGSLIIATKLCKAAGLKSSEFKAKFKVAKSADGKKYLTQVRCKLKNPRRMSWVGGADGGVGDINL